MNIITPVILIIISIGTFFAYIDPTYRGQNLSGGEKSIQMLLTEDSAYQKAQNDTTAIRNMRQKLEDEKSKFNPEDILKLEKLLPDNIDNIKLIIDLNNIGSRYNLALKGMKLDTGAKADQTKLGADNNKYGTVGISFSVTTSYDVFHNFLDDLEKSLRLVDIVDLTINSNPTGQYDFSINLKTYWLK